MLCVQHLSISISLEQVRTYVRKLRNALMANYAWLISRKWKIGDIESDFCLVGMENQAPQRTVLNSKIDDYERYERLKKELFSVKLHEI